jgi:hypothetical protein
MPYIRKEYRPEIDHLVNLLFGAIHDSGGSIDFGRINYAVSKLLWMVFKHLGNYDGANSIVGVLECIKQEFYRRKVSPYEDLKMQSEINGDLDV